MLFVIYVVVYLLMLLFTCLIWLAGERRPQVSRVRTVFTGSQTAELERLFRCTEYPPVAARAALAQSTRLPEETVRVRPLSSSSSSLPSSLPLPSLSSLSWSLSSHTWLLVYFISIFHDTDTHQLYHYYHSIRNISINNITIWII